MAAPLLVAEAASLDAALPGLAAALSPHPPGTAAGDRCRVRSVEWVPRRRCTVVQEVSGPERTTLLGYEVTPTGTTVSRPEDDRGLPGLAAALSPARVRHRLAEVCRAPVRGCRVTPVAHRPGSRAVVAYDVRADGAPARFYAKLLADGPDRSAAVAAAIADGARRLGLPAPVPEVVAVWPDLGAVVQRAAAGRALSDLLRTLPGRDALGYAEALGRLLAGVHATPCGPLPAWTAEDEVAALETLLPAAWHADPAAGRSLAALVDRLAGAVPVAGEPVLTHGAFRAGQVLADGGALTLLDLDTVSRSDPARDAGNALAYLDWAEVRRVLQPEATAALHRAFAAGYAGARPGWDEQSLAWWSAAAMTKVAGRRFRALAAAEWPLVPELLRRAVACLDPAAPPLPLRPAVLASPPAVERITECLRPAAAGDVRVLAVRPLTPAGGRRCVVRYDVEGLGPGRRTTVIGKTYADRHRAAIAWANLRSLEEVFAGTPGLTVPAPVCLVPALQMVLYREVAGTPLDRLPAGAAATAARLAGRWLATLHAGQAVLARRVDLTHEVHEVQEWARCVGEAAPAVRRTAARLADRIAAAAPQLPVVAEVPVHKDLHAGHVIVLGDRPAGGGATPGVAVIDLDEARMGDPALDVAHFTAHLGAWAEPGAHEVRTAFRAGYGPVPGPAAACRTAFYTAHTCMKMARQLATGHGPVTGRPGSDPTVAVAAVLRRGLACLAG